MIRSISIQNFRGIRAGELTGFTSLSVLVGPNGSGKSAVLDALLLTGAEPDPAIQRISQRRPNSGNQWMAWLIFRELHKDAAPAVLILRSDSKNQRRFVLSPTSPNAFGGITVNYETGPEVGTLPLPKAQSARSPRLEDISEVVLIDTGVREKQISNTDLFSIVLRRGLGKEAKAIVTDLVPDLETIEIVTEGNQPAIDFVYKKLGSQPIALAGDGVQLLFRQVYEMAAVPGGTVLIEEPEIHMHPAALRQIARAVLATVRRGIQVILSTHSLDLIDYLLSESTPVELEKFSIFRLQLKSGDLICSRLSGVEAALSRAEIQDDLR